VIRSGQVFRQPEWIAHRGSSHLAPENTMASLQLAWLTGADAVEVDVRLTLDGKLVLFHDDHLMRICGVKGSVEENVLEELLLLDVGKWKGEQWKGERIPELDRVLSLLPDGKRIFIEIKSGMEVLDPLMTLLEKEPNQDTQRVVITFSLELAAAVKRKRKSTTVCWLVDLEERRSAAYPVQPKHLIEAVRDHDLDGLDLSFTSPELDSEVLRAVCETDLQSYVWTVNHVDTAQAAMKAGVHGVTTDRPAWLKEQLLAKNGWELMPTLR